MLLCELDGRVLGGMQFEVLVDAGVQFGVLVGAALRA